MNGAQKVRILSHSHGETIIIITKVFCVGTLMEFDYSSLPGSPDTQGARLPHLQPPPPPPQPESGSCCTSHLNKRQKLFSLQISERLCDCRGFILTL